MMRPDNNQRGIAMMVVLWVLVFLTALATEFAFSMKTEVNTTRNYKEDAESYELAKAGIHLAMAELLKPARFHSIHPELGWISGRPKQDGTTATDNQNTNESEYVVVERKDISLGAGTITYSITDENGKFPINTASRGDLIKILNAVGMEPGVERDTVADSILDWIDPDDTHRLNGAERDFYKSRFPPYSAKNGNIESITELLKVKGIDEELLFGTDSTPGLDQYFTLYNVTSFNPNTALEEILPAVYSPDQVNEILNARAEKGYYNDTLSSHFRIESTGRIEGSGTRHTIVTVVQLVSVDGNPSLNIHYWNDNEIES